MLDYIQSSALRHYYDENNIQISDSAILILDENSIGSESDRANHYHALPMFIEYQKDKHK